jgi:hypothetical protein
MEEINFRMTPSLSNALIGLAVSLEQIAQAERKAAQPSAKKRHRKDASATKPKRTIRLKDITDDT